MPATNTFFPNHWRFTDNVSDCQWIVDSGYPLSQLCKTGASVADNDGKTDAVFGDPDTPICKTLKPTRTTAANACGILGVSYISKHRIDGTMNETQIDGSCSATDCVPVTVKASAPGTNMFRGKSYTNLINVPASFSTPSKSMKAACFLDTGGCASLMSESMASDLGIQFREWTQDSVQHTSASGAVVDTPVYVGANTMMTASIGKTNVTPNRLVVVPDNFNTLFKHKCSIGQDYLANVDELTLDLPKKRICLTGKNAASYSCTPYHRASNENQGDAWFTSPYM